MTSLKEKKHRKFVQQLKYKIIILTSGSDSVSKSIACLPCEDATAISGFPYFAPLCDVGVPTLVLRG